MSVENGKGMDLYPQILTVSITQGAINTFLENTVALPIARTLGGKSDQVWVIELLKVQFFMGGSAFSGAVARQAGVMTIRTAPHPTGTTVPDFTSPVTLWGSRFAIITVGAAGSSAHDDGRIFDMTDSKGRGILVGTDNIYVALWTTGLAVVQTGVVKIYYRFVKVNPLEFVGIVQSQQQR